MKLRTESLDLREARLNSGHTVRSLAKELGIDHRTLVRLEERKLVHPAKAKKVADFFGVQVTDLMPADPEREAA